MQPLLSQCFLRSVYKRRVSLNFASEVSPGWKKVYVLQDDGSDETRAWPRTRAGMVNADASKATG